MLSYIGIMHAVIKSIYLSHTNSINSNIKMSNTFVLCVTARQVVTKELMLRISGLPMYTVSKKNDTDVAHYNFNAHQPTLVIFGGDIAERICY